MSRGFVSFCAVFLKLVVPISLISCEILGVITEFNAVGRYQPRCLLSDCGKVATATNGGVLDSITLLFS